MIQEFAELPKEKRSSNLEWVNDVIIPRLIEKKLPLIQVARVLFRAVTLGVKDKDFKQTIETLILNERKQAALDLGI